MSTASKPTEKESKKRSVEERLDSLESVTSKQTGLYVELFKMQELLTAKFRDLEQHNNEHCSHIHELQNLALPQLAKADKEAQENKRVRIQILYPIFGEQLGDVKEDPVSVKKE